MRHKDVRSTRDVPRRTYYVTYRGVELFVETKPRAALARLPEDVRGWRILCRMEGAAERIVFPGKAAPRAVAA